MRVKLAKWGNSLGVRLPKAAADAAGLRTGTEVDVMVEGRDLRIRRLARTKHYRLEDLLAEMDRLGPANRPDLSIGAPTSEHEIIDDDYSRGLSQHHSGMDISPSGKSRKCKR